MKNEGKSFFFYLRQRQLVVFSNETLSNRYSLVLLRTDRRLYKPASVNIKGESRLTDFTTASAHPAVQQKGLSATLVFTLFQQQRSNKETNLSFDAISSALTRRSYQEIYFETFRMCSKVFNSPLGLTICTQLQALIFFFKVF